jgi:hypothetical protein
MVPSQFPDRVADLIQTALPARVREAVIVAANEAYIARVCRAPQYREARESALGRLAAANKLLAAYNPGLIVTAGGAQ